ncbi:MAG TPA: phosphoglycerate kinase [Tenericutes bacterium]|nr:phosphoglycerate kinase [Mycoplasmatota bacterium]
MKKTIKDFDLNGKRVIIRVDFNVPIKNGIISDDNRIKESLQTIKYALDNNAKIILLSHLGRVKKKEDLKINDLEPISKRLSELLNKKIIFIPHTRGKIVEDIINNMNNQDIVLLQNTRYEDLDSKKESSNDIELGKYWANLGDIFINDAFGTSHRAHASNVGIASNIPSGIGFLVEKELEILGNIINKPKRPFILILGGAKVSDKIGVIENLVNIADYILIAGGMAYTFLKSQGISIGNSLLDVDSIDFSKNILEKYSDKIILPIDSVVAESISDKTNYRTCFINEIKYDEIGVDIGPLTLKLFKHYLEKAQTVIWNGPVGIFEIDNFANGTKKLLQILKGINADVILGGGDTASAAINMGYKNSFKHISTGGGASLEMLEGKALLGVEIIDERNK